MDTKTKILFSAVGVMLLVASGLSYHRLVIKRDYTMYLYLPCDPAIESCFVGDCSDLEEGELCYDPYKIVERSASSLPRECEEMSIDACPEMAECDDESCSVITCDDETAAEEETECVYSGDETGRADENQIQ